MRGFWGFVALRSFAALPVDVFVCGMHMVEQQILPSHPPLPGEECALWHAPHLKDPPQNTTDPQPVGLMSLLFGLNHIRTAGGSHTARPRGETKTFVCIFGGEVWRTKTHSLSSRVKHGAGETSQQAGAAGASPAEVDSWIHADSTT